MTKKKAPKKKTAKKRRPPTATDAMILKRMTTRLRKRETELSLITFQMEALIATARAETKMANNYRDQAFRERDMLIRALSTVWPSDLIPVKDRLNWNWAVCIHAPTGQLSWRISDALADELYQHLPRLTENHWDGHSMKTKYARLAALVPPPLPQES